MYGVALVFLFFQLFTALGNTSEELSRRSGLTSDLWLAVEAFEYLPSETCSPVTPIPPYEKVLSRTSKERIDRALAHGGATVKGAMAFSFDPYYTCTTAVDKIALREEIRSDANRPIVVGCFLHSAFNRSVVVIGFNLEGETQGFQVSMFYFNFPWYFQWKSCLNIFTNKFGYYTLFPFTSQYSDC